jgi:hypothetical protein
MSILNKLTEGIVNRDLQKEGDALRSKWERTGLLEGLGDERNKDTMSVLLENQAKELLRESSAMASGDVEGFAAVAFPIVRRVFGGLIANDLVSVQPMSLPSGLIFFLDFQFDPNTAGRLGSDTGDSLFGGGVVGQQVTGGVDLGGVQAEKSFYALNNGYSSPTGSVATLTIKARVSGTVGGLATDPATDHRGMGLNQDEFDRLLRFDADLTPGVSTAALGTLQLTGSATGLADLNFDDLVTITVEDGLTAGNIQLRRLTQFSGSDAGLRKPGEAKNAAWIVLSTPDGSVTPAALATDLQGVHTISFAVKDNFDNVSRSGAEGAVVGSAPWNLESNESIPEIDIKVDSVSVTAVTKKLKAKWTPELGQDLNAYHNLDAEVELTSILSEQIALEIDREILEDLIKGASAGTFYWSRSPGLFVNRETGAEIGAGALAPDFTGTVSEWYETLIETVNDISAQIHRKTLRGGANFIVCSPEVASVLEMTAGYRANVTVDSDRGTVGAVRVGNLSKKWDVFVDPYFPRNVVLVGRKGNSFLESGYVYAPYVPLQVTPTIFGVEDFVPRKGVMTRYAKKMVRPDMYGLVVVRGLLGESGA